MQKNWRTEYFKNLIKDKTRTKRWRKVLLCLSCVVVFWTVYALILPAITLESKKCNIEEHTHSAECYSESQELICGKEEHVHTAECTSINNDLSDSGEEAGTVPDASGNDANGNEEGKNTPEESVIPEESVVPAEPEPSSGTGTTETPGETGEYVLNDHTDQITSVTFTYKKNGKEVEVDKGQTIDQVKVKPEVYAVMKTGSVKVTNRYRVSADNACDKSKGENDPMNGMIDEFGRDTWLNEYTWVQKTKGDSLTVNEDVSVPSDQEKYEYTDAGLSKMTSNTPETSESFIVPAGSYKYTVIVNKTLGQWDVTEATMTDTLSPEYMQYVGYMKITAHNEVSNKDVEIKWVNIDGKSTFSLKPSDIGWRSQNYSYQFEYYATPKNLGTISKENVTNTFKLDKARRNGQDFTFGDAVKSSQTVTITGNYNLSAQKKAWYYEKPEENATTWQNGQLYWIIEVKGNVIKAGTQIKDAVSWDKVSFIHNNGESIAGAYQGNLDGIETRYKNFAEFQQANTASKKEINELFELSYNGNRDGFDNGEHNGRFNDMFIKAKKDIELGENQNLYIIVRTEPLDLPEEYREPKRYENRLFIIDSGKSENEQRAMGSAEQRLYNGGDILKELGQTFEYDRTDGTNGTVKVKITYGEESKESKESTTVTYTLQIPVFKYTGDEKKPLAGAKFALYESATGGEAVKLVQKENTQDYRRALKTESGITEVETTSTGEFNIQGLKPGTYWLEETAAPKGYNKLAKRIEVKIVEHGTLVIDGKTTENNSPINKVNVENKSGSLLPSTGGMGTTIFYIAGAFLVLISGVVLIAKKRTDSK